MIRPSIRVLLPRGRFSSMLDMGGMSPADTSAAAKRIDTGKNNEVRAIALDFDLITRSIEASRKKKEEEKQGGGSNSISSMTKGKPALDTDIKPDASAVESIAGLLGVNLGGSGGDNNEEEGRHLGRKRFAVGSGGIKDNLDDLSTLTGETKDKNATKDDSIQNNILSSLSSQQKQQQQSQPQKPKPNTQKAPPTIDIRSKYASKLRKKLESTGSTLSSIERAKTESSELSKKGDAADHLAARAAAITVGGSSSTKWMASTGTGALLSFLTSRSMTVALLPPLSKISIPSSSSSSTLSFFSKGKENENEEETTKIIDETLQTKMNDLSTQLPNAQIALQLSYTNLSPPSLLNMIYNETHIQPSSTLVVSDRDDYLRVAKEKGMYTCRVRFSKNAPRGNVSTNYDVVDVAEVMNVVNEINGISFHSVLGGFGKKIDHGGV